MRKISIKNTWTDFSPKTEREVWLLFCLLQRSIRAMPAQSKNRVYESSRMTPGKLVEYKLWWLKLKFDFHSNRLVTTNAHVLQDSLVNHVKRTLMIVWMQPVWMVAHVKIWWTVMNVNALSLMLELTVRKVRCFDAHSFVLTLAELSVCYWAKCLPNILVHSSRPFENRKA